MKFKIILLGLLSFIIALLATAPMSVLAPFIPANSPVQLSEVSGTLWNGHAKTVHYQKIALGKLHWKIHPLAIFTGRLSATVSIDGKDIQLDTRLDLRWDQSIELRQTQAQIETHFLQHFKQIPVSLGGVIKANMSSILIKEIPIQDKQLPLMSGQVDWLQGEALSLPLGSYALTLSVINDQQHVEIKSKNSENILVNLKGKIELDQQGNYQAKLKIKAEKAAAPLIVNGIAALGKKEQDGFIKIEKKGNLQSLLP